MVLLRADNRLHVTRTLDDSVQISPSSVYQAQSLRNSFGAWPPPEFNKLTENQMTEFWNTIKDADGKDLQKIADDTLTRFRETGESYVLGGII